MISKADEDFYHAWLQPHVGAKLGAAEVEELAFLVVYALTDPLARAKRTKAEQALLEAAGTLVAKKIEKMLKEKGK